MAQCPRLVVVDLEHRFVTTSLGQRQVIVEPRVLASPYVMRDLEPDLLGWDSKVNREGDRSDRLLLVAWLGRDHSDPDV
jgi:hypothetical protein